MLIILNYSDDNAPSSQMSVASVHCAPPSNRSVIEEPTAAPNIEPQQQQSQQARPPPLRSSLYRATLPRDFPTSYDVANASAWYPEERSNRPMPVSDTSPADLQSQFPNRQYYVPRNRPNTAANNNNPNNNNNSMPLQTVAASSPPHSPSNGPVAPNTVTLMPASNEAVDTSTNASSAGPTADDMPTNRPLFLNPHTGNWSHASRSQVSSRCPFMLQDRNRRYTSGHHYNIVHHQFPYALQNNNYHPVRPAYAPHENLWYRQQNNQEMHRRHLMTGGNDANNDGFNTVSGNGVAPNRASAAPASNAVYCLACDHQHPNGMSHQPGHRRIRAYVCSDPPPLRNVFIGR